MRKKECIALILAGGQGSRLGVLTKKVAKPAVNFGGKYRIIDFPLSNCTNSNIDTVGVLTQYQPLELNSYIGSGQPWDLDRSFGGVYLLPPYMKAEAGTWYKGTANAIYQNMNFIQMFNPDYVLILSGDHIYKMNYAKMVDFHIENNADATISCIKVPWDQASRFGIMKTDKTLRITEFFEKPKNPVSNMASMGVYVFKWEVLKEYLIKDEEDPRSSNDFGKNVIPTMLHDGKRMFAYNFKGYWKDVGTVYSLWEANMELLHKKPGMNLFDRSWRIYSKNAIQPPHYTADGAVIKDSMITEGSVIYGKVKNSVISSGVKIGKNTVIEDSVLFPSVVVEDNCVIKKAIIGERSVVRQNSRIGVEDMIEGQIPSKMCSDGIVLIGSDIVVKSGSDIAKNVMVE
ncbi:MAG TPA: glucose-1-phosphate adenylyltransferase [Clostridia bacterium]|jgi:glucose-1-phosphate adenylyltransferase|nr:glucose-1-phosphate adenylyltransferase [Clostridiaceae bacterium]HOF27315.1 glucose-1-phosphate adenylyltransferase [Clostridia bacterium]HOM35071.1 glucose-1-phosphate adenylyltransferase [Clostridia bacterium]HOR90481.1 glucose-1-phosphate adenylyltransferase [Clostridia bacterium]HOT71548.1 glucose-1-phosphate adenylyltransferase [Clostridia bacterium]